VVGKQRGDGTLLERSRMWFSVKIGGGGKRWLRIFILTISYVSIIEQ
jgi:hypothetical protein